MDIIKNKFNKIAVNVCTAGISDTKEKKARNALDWKEEIELANNSTYLGRKRVRGGNGHMDSVHMFSATPFAAKGIERSIQSNYPNNQVIMNVKEKYSIPLQKVIKNI